MGALVGLTDGDALGAAVLGAAVGLADDDLPQPAFDFSPRYRLPSTSNDMFLEFRLFT